MKKKSRLNKFTKCLLSMMLAVTLFFSSAVPAQANVMGIDVSRWNGQINWNEVAAAGIPYAFIRVGTTKGGVDMRFYENVINAQAAGIRTGVYIYSYATNVEEAIMEALLVLQWIENCNINFPVAYDIEDDIHHKLDPATVTAMCNAFCDVIASAGYHPIVYTGAWFYKNKIVPGGLRYDKWIAHYYKECGVPDYDIWQASNTGRLPGIAGDVDINYMAKDYRNVIFPYGFVQKEDGVYFYNNFRIHFGWLDLEGLRFHMGPTGRMDTGWFADETGVYYLANDGHALTGQNIIEGDGYIFNELGAMQTGWQDVGPYKYFYDPLNGNRLYTGWLHGENGKYYLSPVDGHMVTGNIAIDNKIYLFSTEGLMQTGWQEVNGLRYYYLPIDGSMYTGWFDDIDGRYYLSELDGHMVTGYTAIGDSNYFFNEKGQMQRGIVTIGEGKFYFDPFTGAQTTGWVNDGINRYYFTPLGGQMLTGLHAVDGQIFYFNEQGQMQTGLQKVNGLTYYFDPQSGAMTTGWVMTPQTMLYFSELDGHMLTNEISIIENVPRCFADNGALVANGAYTIGATTYVCDANGVVIFPSFGPTALDTTIVPNVP